MEPFDTFYHTHVRFVYAIALARGLAPCEAEDLVQEAFLRAWHHFGAGSALALPTPALWHGASVHARRRTWCKKRSCAPGITSDSFRTSPCRRSGPGCAVS